MSTIIWRLFNTDISESIKDESQQKKGSDFREFDENDNFRTNIQNKDIVEFGENSEESEFSVSDVIRNAFYTATLKKIHSNNEYLENRAEYIKRLNDLDGELNKFFASSKNILNSLDEEHGNINGDDNQQMQNAVYNYANAVYESIKNRNKDIKRFEGLEREIKMMLPSNDIQMRIEENFKEIRKLVVQCISTNDRADKVRLIRRVYAKVRKLPVYLGSPYRERYLLYNRLQKYPKLHDSRSIIHTSDSGNNRATIVYMLMIGTSFDIYFNKKYEEIIRYIEEIQENVCNIGTIVFQDDFERKIYDLNRLIKNSTRKVKEKYSSKDGGCFSIIDLYLVNGYKKEYICFSGVLDLEDTDFQKMFIKNQNNADAVNNAIRKIVNSSEFSNSELIKSNGRIRYYYGNGNDSYIMLWQLCQSVKIGHEKTHRMFSCCERKFYTVLENFRVYDVEKYIMFTKYNACPMCEDAINTYKNIGYADEIIYGITKEYTAGFKTKYDRLANCIGDFYNKIGGTDG